MTWAEWIRAILRFDEARVRAIQDAKVSAYFTAVLLRQRRLPTLRRWLANHSTRVVTGAERDRLRHERQTIEADLSELKLRLDKKKQEH